MELWDGYNADRTLAGRDIVRGEVPPADLYHLVADVIVQHTDGTFLVMQRDPVKEHGGGMWEIGAGGSVLKGESAYDGALRELREETGIAADKLLLLREVSEVYHRVTGYNSHYSTYYCRTDIDKSAVTLQQGETVDFRWISAEQIIKERLIPRRSIELIDMMVNNRLIVTQRLSVRALAMSDLAAAHCYASDRELTKYMMNLPNDTIAETQDFIQKAVEQWESSAPKYYEYAVLLDNKQIGAVCLYPESDGRGELGWILSSEYHGMGYAREAACAMITLAEKLGLSTVYARCDSRNHASEQLMISLGMTLKDRNGTRYYSKCGETSGEFTYEKNI